MQFKDVFSNGNTEVMLINILNYIHEFGPDDQHMLELLSYIKKFDIETFERYEVDLISALGTFYKIKNADSFYSHIMNSIGLAHQTMYGTKLTPVQANIRQAIEQFKYTSISAPTSAGKSFSIKDFILHSTGDAVIVVPSRALIAEYVLSVRDYFNGNKNVMISSFPDVVYKKRMLRRVFVLTPERCDDLFKLSSLLNVELFFFDEAHISEDQDRGLIFESLIKKVIKNYPTSKIVFAHPFVDNPEAQFSKNNISDESKFSKAYHQGVVGKIFIQVDKEGQASYFSPFESKGYYKKNLVAFEGRLEEFIFSNKFSVLVYVSKQSLYEDRFLLGFQEFIDSFELIQSNVATSIVDKISDIIGANDTDHSSRLISLLRRGVVIHHGSVPLEVRFLIEEFIRKGFARICFATSTLAQGVNMPFDVVWLDCNRFMGDENERSLAFKNLIGRAGRLSDLSKFDFGYVVTNNSKLVYERINHSFLLSPESLINRDDITYQDTIQTELVDSLRNGTFDEEFNVPQSRADRLRDERVKNSCIALLDIFYGDEVRNVDFNVDNKISAVGHFKIIYEASLGRVLLAGEEAIFSNAIHILFHMMKGRTFREIAGIRYSFIADKNGLNLGMAVFSQPASAIPDIKLKSLYSIYKKNTYAKDVSYDRIVFDTYDYIDQVLTFSISEVITTAFYILNESFEDTRIALMIDLLKYGTNDKKHIMLMRYGFSAEQIEKIYGYVLDIDLNFVKFSNDVLEADDDVIDAVSWYL